MTTPKVISTKPKFNFGDEVRRIGGNPDRDDSHYDIFMVTRIRKNYGLLGGYFYAGEAIGGPDWIHESELVKNIPTRRYYLYAKKDTGYLYATMMDETGMTPSGKQVEIDNLVRLAALSVDLPFDPKPHAKKKSPHFDFEEDEED